MRKSLPAAICTLAVLAVCAAASPLDDISADHLRKHVEILASDEFMGRETGEEGIRAAEEYIREAFRAIGLRPLPGKESYDIDYMLYRQAFDLQETLVRVDVGGRPVSGVVSQDFRPFEFSDEGSVRAEVVFVGYGITAPEFDYDDYADLDVEGKLVFMLRHEPGERDSASVFDGANTTGHSYFRQKAENARDHGAAGMLLVTDPVNHQGEAEDFRSGGALRLDADDFGASEPDSAEERFLAVHISRDMAEHIVAGTGWSLEELQVRIDAGSRPEDLPLGDVTAEISIRYAGAPEEVPSKDIAGFLEGSDPVLKDEIVVIGAHHDHIGGFVGTGDTVYNGADDNASGTAAVLELARVFGRSEERPRRSLLFVTFSGEEKGLLGSKAMVQQDLIPVDRVRFMLNMDMIGRNPDRPLDVIGDGFARGLTGIVERANEEVHLDLDFNGDAYSGDSDHDAFYKAGIPFTFLFTGIHEDYHQLGDHADKLDYDRMARIVRLGGELVSRIADMDEPPQFIHHVGWLGAHVEVLKENGSPAAVVTSVDPGSRGDRAGLREGDVILAVDDVALDRPENVGRRLRDVEPGTEFRLGVRSGNDERVLVCERAKVGYLGIGPGSVDDDVRSKYGLPDGQGILVREVSPGGPAAGAGLLADDVLVRIGGEPVGRRSLRRTLARIGAGETVSVMVIRAGDWLTMDVTLGERPSFRR